MTPMPDAVDDVDARTARRLWQLSEVLHGVVYFNPDALAVIGGSGVKGFWMGYFTTRLAPLGAVSAEVGTAVSFGFSPARLERALPDGWTHLSPGRALHVRSEAACAALEPLVDEGDVGPLVELLEPLVGALDPVGRALGAANQSVPAGEGALERLWQAVTTLREHRGDGHNAVLLAEGLDGCGANVLAAAVRGSGAEMLRRSRGWTDERWEGTVGELAEAGLVEVARADDTDGVSATEEGRALHRRIEARTDALAWRSYRATGAAGDIPRLVDLLEGPARQVYAAGHLPQPNPIGLDLDA